MKSAITAVAALAALATPQTAAAGTSPEYFLAHVSNRDAPAQLNVQDREYYAAVFVAIEQQQWDKAQELLAQRTDGLLHAVAQGELYLAPNSPRVEADQIAAWLPRGQNLPKAPQMVRLGLTRGVENAPPTPLPRAMVPTAGPPKRIRPRMLLVGVSVVLIATSAFNVYKAWPFF